MTQAAPPPNNAPDSVVTTEAWIEGDIVYMRSKGTTTLDDLKRMFAICQQVCDEYGYALVLADSRIGGKSSPEARKYQTDMLRKRIFPSHTAMYGGNLVARTAVILVMRAVELVTGTKVPVDLCEDEASARKVLDEARARFRAQGIAKK